MRRRAMPTSPLKRSSAGGGRLGRLLASLRPPARAGPLPVQTGFPTSLADLVVKNHVRLRNPRRRPAARASAAAPAPPPAPPAAASPPSPRQRCEAVTVQKNAAVEARPKDAAFSIRPEVVAVGGTVALALLVIWSKWLVAAATAASVALLWVDSSVRSSSSASTRRPDTAEGAIPSSGRGIVSPIREEAGSESEAGTPRSSCADSDSGSEVSFSLWAAPDAADQLGGGGDGSVAPTSKGKMRSSLRKLIARKLRTGKRRSRVEKQGQPEPEAGGEAVLVNNDSTPVVMKTEPSSPVPAMVDPTPPDAVTVEVERRGRAGGAAPSSAAAFLVPIILVGLVAGKLPAVALTVLCAVVFFGSAQPPPPSSPSAECRRSASLAREEQN